MVRLVTLNKVQPVLVCKDLKLLLSLCLLLYMHTMASDRLSLCHGPIAQTSVEGVLKKFRVEEGHFLVRESRTMDDAYTLSVCHNTKVMHYRIVRHEDGMYSFRDPDGRGDGGQNRPHHEYEKFPSLHDLIKSYHQKAVRFFNNSVRVLHLT